MTGWDAEPIPSGHRVFMRIHATFVDGDEVSRGAFKNHGVEPNAGMSTNWEKYCPDPEMTRQQARKNPMANGVVSFVVGDLRAIEGQRVEHTPDIERDNRCHTDVFGDKDEEVRLKLARLITWHLRVGE